MNDYCINAIAISDGNYLGSTMGAKDVNETDSCVLSARIPGVWYSVNGTGRELNVNTRGTNDDTVIAVFKGSCENLECLGLNDDISRSNLQSSLTWLSEAGVEYKVLVYGFGTIETFNLELHTIDMLRVGPIGTSPKLRDGASEARNGEQAGKDTKLP